MANLFERLSRLLGLKNVNPEERKGARNVTPAIRDVLNETSVQSLMEMLEKTSVEELSCEETFAVLDAYVDLLVNKQDAAALMPLVRRHIDLCADCSEEYEALLRVLQSDPQ